MDCPDYITVEPERKPGQHLQQEDRGAIQRLHRLGYSNRAILGSKEPRFFEEVRPFVFITVGAADRSGWAVFSFRC
ncbi:MAG: hypothetical protein ACERKO_09580 [Acetanaerobacterium sp.]